MNILRFRLLVRQNKQLENDTLEVSWLYIFTVINKIIGLRLQLYLLHTASKLQYDFNKTWMLFFLLVFRLISERTVEENILKKANQKRMLGDMAIEGGNFTTAFFKQVGVYRQMIYISPSNSRFYTIIFPAVTHHVTSNSRVKFQ